MPTLSEFTLTIGLREFEADETRETFFRFETQRQFRAFRYEVEIEHALNLDQNVLEFKIKGVNAAAGLMSSPGSGVNEIVYPELSGEFTANIAGSKKSGSLRFNVHDTEVELLEVDEGGFVKVQVANEIEIIKA